MHEEPRCQKPQVLGVGVDDIDWQGAVERIGQWAECRESKHVCLSNAHSIVTASRSEQLRQALRLADLVLPDGAPVAWMLRRLGSRGQTRISGPDLMWRVCERATASGIKVYLYGSTEAVLSKLEQRLKMFFPNLHIVGRCSPPFRELTGEESAHAVDHINASGAGLVFVGLGCPKQEVWMAANRGRLRAVMIGVGAAFDFHAGTLQRAPVFMRERGLEWLHRLASEPGRLWKRYLVTNTLFMLGAAWQLLRTKRR
jgi:N-acetylglucosaminyldiphosphoundecaprenol N-acetyl-beta-D-mannosaminyltransferase